MSIVLTYKIDPIFFTYFRTITYYSGDIFFSSSSFFFFSFCSIFNSFAIDARNKRVLNAKLPYTPLRETYFSRTEVFVGFSTSYVRNDHFYLYVSPRGNTCRLIILLNNSYTSSSRVFVPSLYI